MTRTSCSPASSGRIRSVKRNTRTEKLSVDGITTVNVFVTETINEGKDETINVYKNNQLGMNILKQDNISKWSIFYTCHKLKSSLLILNCHLEVYYKVDRLLSDDSILDNSKLRVSIIKKYSKRSL